MAGVILQQRIDADRMFAGQMVVDHRIGQRDQQAVAELRDAEAVVGVIAQAAETFGAIDIVVNNKDYPSAILRNDTKNDNHWIRLELQGTRSNRAAIGARVGAVMSGSPMALNTRS